MVEPFQLLCQICTAYFSHSMNINSLDIQGLIQSEFVDSREFFFKKLIFANYYGEKEKAVFQMAKFQNDGQMQNFLIHRLTELINIQGNNESGCVLPAPSSREFVSIFAKEISKKLNTPLIQVFTKTSSQQNKNKDQFSRYHDIYTNIKLRSEKIDLVKKYNQVYILDDIWTTGATMNHMSRLLTLGGIKPENISCIVMFVRPKINAGFSCHRDVVSSFPA